MKHLNKIIFVVTILVLIISLIGIAKEGEKYLTGRLAYRKVSEAADVRSDAKEEKDKLSVDFDRLEKINKDVKAWIYSEGTNINYPVVQTDNNEKYLIQMFDLQWNGCGSLFIDYRCKNPFKDFSTIIYGHRMKDGSMFGSFGKYRKQNYFDSHKELEIKTKTGNYRLKLFAVITVPATSGLLNTQPRTTLEKKKFLGEIKKLNTITTDLDISPRENIVLLSTCTYEFEDARLVLCGKLTSL